MTSAINAPPTRDCFDLDPPPSIASAVVTARFPAHVTETDPWEVDWAETIVLVAEGLKASTIDRLPFVRPEVGGAGELVDTMLDVGGVGTIEVEVVVCKLPVCERELETVSVPVEVLGLDCRVLDRSPEPVSELPSRDPKLINEVRVRGLRSSCEARFGIIPVLSPLDAPEAVVAVDMLENGAVTDAIDEFVPLASTLRRKVFSLGPVLIEKTIPSPQCGTGSV
jgi:hypothetical protein